MRSQTTRYRKISRVLITRSSQGNAELGKRLEAAGFEPVMIDTIGFEPPSDWSEVDSFLERINDFDWLLFTSATGAEFFLSRSRALSITTSWQDGPMVAALGEKTAARLREGGVRVDFVPSSFTTMSLAQELPRSQEKRVLIFRAEVGVPGFVPALEKAGFLVKDVAIYRTAPTRKPIPLLLETDAIIFASPSAVDGLMVAVDPIKEVVDLKSKLALCIGPVTADAARSHGFTRVSTASTHTLDGVIELLKQESGGHE